MLSSIYYEVFSQHVYLAPDLDVENNGTAPTAREQTVAFIGISKEKNVGDAGISQGTRETSPARKPANTAIRIAHEVDSSTSYRGFFSSYCSRHCRSYCPCRASRCVPSTAGNYHSFHRRKTLSLCLTTRNIYLPHPNYG